MIRLIAGVGAEFGTGHLKRMEKLAEYLTRRNHSTVIVAMDSSTPLSRLEADDASKCRLTVFDARDVDPQIATGRVIALDNRHPNRRTMDSRVVFHDTIPHPDVSMTVAMQNCLVDPEFCDQASNGRRALIYAGSWHGDPPGLDILASLGYELVQVGGQKNPRVTWHERLSPVDFRQEMCRSSLVFTYFGMTALQAMYLKKQVILFSIGDVHDRLSLNLAQIGVPFIRSAPVAADFTSTAMPAMIPGGRGFDFLLSLIEEQI
ncbi:MAG: hypothetical protein JNM27_21885 [Leptospirales bacterium]|nr:hypothetical protein [Leptospirales bacterium]